MATLATLKLRGLTAASATLGTADVRVDSDNFLRFTDPNGNKHAIPLVGSLALLVKLTCTGDGGLPETRSAFGAPGLSANGDGVRSDS